MYDKIYMKTFGLIVYFIGFLIAAIMSWRCSGLQGRAMSTRVTWSLISGLGSWYYVLYNYWVMNWDTCDAQGLARLCTEKTV